MRTKGVDKAVPGNCFRDYDRISKLMKGVPRTNSGLKTRINSWTDLKPCPRSWSPSSMVSLLQIPQIRSLLLSEQKPDGPKEAPVHPNIFHYFCSPLCGQDLEHTWLCMYQKMSPRMSNITQMRITKKSMGTSHQLYASRIIMGELVLLLSKTDEFGYMVEVISSRRDTPVCLNRPHPFISPLTVQSRGSTARKMDYTKQELQIHDYLGIPVAFAWFCGVTWLFSVTFIKLVYAQGPTEQRPTKFPMSSRQASMSEVATSMRK
uniref:Spt4 domain-containing protein n=1 Tax=Steinernema glaseri TaxID=37863 RepID=A0A1I7Z2L1_9BILA